MVPRLLGLLALPFMVLGVSAPFGTTILGWIAVAQIRRGAGKLYGLGLAVFDGLLFPLLLLDAVIGMVVLFVIRLLAMHGSPFAVVHPRSRLGDPHTGVLCADRGD